MPAGNPCKKDAMCSHLLRQIDAEIVNNRTAPNDFSSADASPLASARVQRPRPRIEEVSPETPSGVYPSPTRDRVMPGRGLFATGPAEAAPDAASEHSYSGGKKW